MTTNIKACFRERNMAMQVYDRFADRQTRIELATLGNDAGIIGAAYLSQASYL